MMKGICGLMAVLSVFLLAGPAFGENEVLKKACEHKVRQAARLIETLGPQAAFEKITAHDGPFVGEHTHVFCIDAGSGELLAHKVDQFVGYNMHGYFDADDSAPYSEILHEAKTKPNGWKTYRTRGSGPDRRAEPELKHMHFFKMANREIILCAGYFDDL